MAVFLVACHLVAADVPDSKTNSPAHTNGTAASAPAATIAAGNFRIEPGFQLQLAASSPIVVNPGAMAFDENGRLFVIETPEGAGPDNGAAQGRIRVLDETDGNGVYNASAIYAKNLPGPTALICYGGGVFVACGADILYLKDSKGDGFADEQRAVFKGFAEATNGAHGKLVITSMVWGMDNRIYVATSSEGGDVISSSSPTQSLVLPGGNFSFDPRSYQLSAANGSGPGGMCLDNRGRQFLAGERGLQMVMFSYHYFARNSLYQLPWAVQDIIAGAGGARVPYVQDIECYRGSAFPFGYQECIYAADPTDCAVLRQKLVPEDLEMTAPGAPTAFGVVCLSWADHSFQPRYLANAPDGTLYVSGVAQTGPPAAARNVESSGRIYRVIPTGFKRGKVPQLWRLKTEELAIWLRNPNSVQRDAASRLLYERQDKAAILPLVRLLVDLNGAALGRVYALYGLEGLGALTPEQVAKALNDPSDYVREHAVLLSEDFISKSREMPDGLFGQFGHMHSDPSPQVRYQLAFTLGQLNNPGRVRILADLARSDAASPWMRSAVLSSTDGGAAEMLRLLVADPAIRSGDPDGDFLRQLAWMVGAKNRPEDVGQTFILLNNVSDWQLAFGLAQALDEGFQDAGTSLLAVDKQGVLKPLFDHASYAAVDVRSPGALRAQALRLLAATQVPDLQTGLNLVQNWTLYDPDVRDDMAVALLSRLDLTAGLLWGLERGYVPTSDITPLEIRFLLVNPDLAVRQRATNLFGKGIFGRREDVVNRFAPALQMTGVVERGRNIFVSRCAGCHHVGSEGDPRGLGLGMERTNGNATLMRQILDPNHAISPRHQMFLIQTKDGRTLMGFVTRDDTNHVTICQPNGMYQRLPRQNIMAMTTIGLSGMPEGVEAGMNFQNMADLLSFLNPIPAIK